jgi:hypothetical protein
MQQPKNQLIANGDVKESMSEITLPSIHNFLFSLVDENGESIPISSIMINVQPKFSSWKLKVTKSPFPSNKDENGDPVSVGDDESGDNPKNESPERFVDWLSKQFSHLDERIKELTQNAKQKIPIQTNVA